MAQVTEIIQKNKSLARRVSQGIAGYTGIGVRGYGGKSLSLEGRG